MKQKFYVYDSPEAFGRAMGLTDFDIFIAREKNKIIKKLKAKRIKLGLTQKDLAELIDSKQPTIARMESGLVSQASMDFLVKIAMVLEVPISIRPKKAA